MENSVIKYLVGEMTEQERAAIEQTMTRDSAEYALAVAGKQILTLVGYAHTDEKDDEEGKAQYTRFLENINE